MTIPVPSVNDDMLHYLFITNASTVLANGGNVFDHWLSQIDLGLPQFLYYQQLPHLFVIALQRLTLGTVDLLTVFNVVRYVLLVAFPLTVFWSMRRMGFSHVAAALSAAVASLLSGGQLYGFEYDSYVWRGWGMYTQLWAMHLSFITLACVYTALNTGRGMALAVISFSALVLSHLIYAYMMAITILVILLVGMNRANAPTRVVRLGLIGGVAAVISSYMWLPFFGVIAFDNATPYLQPYKYDSFGAPEILSWLVGGQLFDVGRLPVLTFLLGLGILAAIVARRRAAVLVLVLFVVWLVLYFGRPTVGFIVDLLPLSDSLLLHRFIGSVDLAAIILMGVGGAWLWMLIARAGTPIRLFVATAAALLLLAPAIQERFTWYDLNTAWMRRTQVAITADANAASIIATLKTLPPGRVYAGLPSTWGSQIHDADVPFYDLLPFYGIVGVPPPTESMSLNSDYLWDFNDHNQAQYDLYNVRYVVAPTGLAMADFLKPLQRAGPYTLYEAPTSGYAEFVNIVGWEPVADQTALFTRDRPWVNGNGPAERNYIAYDYPSNSTAASGSPTPGCPDGGQILSQDVGLDRYSFVVKCATPSPLVIKATYHPNWQVQIDGQPAKTFMLSPSYLGVQVPAGQHTVTATYQATPIKTPLLLIGAAALLLTLLFGRRFNRIAEAIARPVRLPQGPLPAPGLPVWLRRGRRVAAGSVTADCTRRRTRHKSSDGLASERIPRHLRLLPRRRRSARARLGRRQPPRRRPWRHAPRRSRAHCSRGSDRRLHWSRRRSVDRVVRPSSGRRRRADWPARGPAVCRPRWPRGSRPTRLPSAAPSNGFVASASFWPWPPSACSRRSSPAESSGRTVRGSGTSTCRSSTTRSRCSSTMRCRPAGSRSGTTTSGSASRSTRKARSARSTRRTG